VSRAACSTSSSGVPGSTTAHEQKHRHRTTNEPELEHVPLEREATFKAILCESRSSPKLIRSLNGPTNRSSLRAKAGQFPQAVIDHVHALRGERQRLPDDSASTRILVREDTYRREIAAALARAPRPLIIHASPPAQTPQCRRLACGKPIDRRT
jgi:hypothetical protein